MTILGLVSSLTRGNNSTDVLFTHIKGKNRCLLATLYRNQCANDYTLHFVGFLLIQRRFLDNPRDPVKIPTCQPLQKWTWRNGLNILCFFYIRTLRKRSCTSKFNTITVCHRSHAQPLLYNIKDTNAQRSITHWQHSKVKDSERQTSHMVLTTVTVKQLSVKHKLNMITS